MVDRPPGSNQQIVEIPLNCDQGRREFEAGSGKERRRGRADLDTLLYQTGGIGAALILSWPNCRGYTRLHR